MSTPPCQLHDQGGQLWDRGSWAKGTLRQHHPVMIGCLFFPSISLLALFLFSWKPIGQCAHVTRCFTLHALLRHPASFLPLSSKRMMIIQMTSNQTVLMCIWTMCRQYGGRRDVWRMLKQCYCWPRLDSSLLTDTRPLAHCFWLVPYAAA